MKLFFKNLIKTPMVIVFLFVVSFYGLKALGIPAEVNKYAIVTAVGIDEVDEDDEGNKFEISLLAFIPIAQQSFTETYKVISSKGRSISEAIDIAGLHIGRQIGLSHVKLVVVNEKLLNDDVTKSLDYLSRSKHMTSSTKLIATDSTAKEFLKAAEKLDGQSSIKVSELVSFNDEYIYASDSTFETFFKGLFGPTRVSIMPYLTLYKEAESGVEVEKIGNSESDSETSVEEGQSKQIVNNGDTIILKDGQKKLLLDSKDLKKINLVQGSFNTGSIEIYNFSDSVFKNANMTYEIYNKRIKNKVVFQNGIPVFNIDLTLTLTLSEVENENGMVEENVEFFVITESATKAIEKKVRESIADGLKIMRDNQLDLVNFYTTIYNTDKNSFKKFLKSLKNEDDYLNNVVFKVSVKIYTK